MGDGALVTGTWDGRTFASRSCVSSREAGCHGSLLSRLHSPAARERQLAEAQAALADKEAELQGKQVGRLARQRWLARGLGVWG